MPNALRQPRRPRHLLYHRRVLSPLPRPQKATLYWPAITAAGAGAALLVVCCLAWVARHPRPQAMVLALEPVAQIQRPAATLPAVKSAPAPVPAPPPVPLQAPVTPDLTPAKEETSRPARQSYGTALSFVDDPAEAARLAGAEDRVLFLLHVSGNFEESCFT